MNMWMVLGWTVVAVFVAMFLWELLWNRDPEAAARRTTNRGIGAGLGVFSAVMVALIEGLGMLADLPGLVMGLLGLGAIASGINPQVAMAVMVVSYIALAGIRGEPTA